MYKKYRIILTILGLLGGFGALIMFLWGGYFFDPMPKESLVVLYPTSLISTIILLISDLIYILRKQKISQIIKIIDIGMILFWIIVGIYTYFYIIKFEWFIYTHEMITYLLLGINIIIWILQIIFTFKWNKEFELVNFSNYIQILKTYIKRLLYIFLLILSMISLILVSISFIINITDLFDKSKKKILVWLQILFLIPYSYTIFKVINIAVIYKGESVPLEVLFPFIIIQTTIAFILLRLTLYEDKYKSKYKWQIILNYITIFLFVVAVGINLTPYFLRRYIPESEKLNFIIDLKQGAFMTYPEFESLNSFLNLDNNSEVENLVIKSTIKEAEGKYITNSYQLYGIKDMSIDGIRNHLLTQEVGFKYDGFGEYYVVNPNETRPMEYGKKILSEDKIGLILELIYNDGSSTDNYGGVTYLEIKNLNSDMKEKIRYVCGDLENPDYDRIIKELNINIDKFQKDFRSCSLGQGRDNSNIVEIIRYE